MASAAAAFVDGRSFEGRVFARGDGLRAARAIGRHIAMALAAMATVALLVVGITVAAAWIVNVTVATNPLIHAKATTGPGRLALASADPAQSAAAIASFEARWTRSVASAGPFMPPRPLQVPQSRVTPVVTAALPSKAGAERANGVPMPRPYPGAREAASLPAELAPPQVTPQVAAVAPPPVQNKSLLLPDPDSRTAVYDISARTVYLPNGQKLEAHSGLGDKMDDPRHVRVRMRGPTPPNVYELTLREKLFHGVKAIRLNPVDDSKMFGRDGMLAHSYLLGSNGQSHGCVSFKDYQKFLNAYLNGEVDRLVVVTDRGDTSWRTARAHREPVRRYASYSIARSPAEPSPLTW